MNEDFEDCSAEERQEWVTLPKFFDIGYEYRDQTAKILWHDLDNNALKWFSWTSHSPNYTYEQIVDLVEIFINRHSAIDIEDSRVYTQMPISTFFYAVVGIDGYFVRGAIWSNGAVWEQIPMDGPRRLSLSMDKLTMKSFSYVEPDTSPDSSITKMIDSWANDIENDKNKSTETNTTQT